MSNLMLSMTMFHVLAAVTVVALMFIGAVKLVQD
jgi:hypothetical protein